MNMDNLVTTFEAELTAAARATVQTLVGRIRVEAERVVQAVEEARRQGLAEVEEKRAALEEELRAMEQVQRAQDSRVELDVGGQRYCTSIATLTSKPGCMLSAMFSGRYPLNEEADGSVFIDRDGSAFGFVLEFLRDGVVALDALADVQLLRRVKREFDYYAIDLFERQEVAFAIGGWADGNTLSSVEKYDAASNTWLEVS